MIRKWLLPILIVLFAGLVYQSILKSPEKIKDLRSNDINFFNQPLEVCSTEPLTGYFRNGKCETNNEDMCQHVICAQLTPAFLAYSYRIGNNLSTPIPERNFPGLKEGDQWCICAERWKEAYDQKVAPKIIGTASGIKAFNFVPKNILTNYLIEE